MNKEKRENKLVQVLANTYTHNQKKLRESFERKYRRLGGSTSQIKKQKK